MTTDNSRHRLGLVALTALSLFGALFARLWFLQIVQGESFASQVNQETRRIVVQPAPRGQILDRNGIVLVDNRPSTVVAVDLQAYAKLDKTVQERLLERLSTTLNRRRTPNDAVTPADIASKIEDPKFSRFRPVPLVEDIPVEDEIYFREQAALFPAVVVENQSIRSYPYGTLAAHVLGYVGGLTQTQYQDLKASAGSKPYELTDEIGKAGVESTYESYLRGTPGRRVYEVNRLNQVTKEIVSERIEPTPGDDVYLSIDARLQYKTEEALQAQIIASNTPTPYGAATVLDPRNGQVMAMASYPTYDPTEFIGGITQQRYEELTAAPAKILSNRAIQEAYPAASTFKLASSYAGLKLGLITPDEIVVDKGIYDVGCSGNGTGCKKRNSGGGKAMGPITLPTALTRSSDYYFYRVGVEAWRASQNAGAPEDAFQEQAKVLGYGEKTGIDLTAETAGRIPTPGSNAALADAFWESDHANYDNDEAQYQDARRWKAGFSADIAIGQFDVTVTPLQSANAYASLANNESTLFEPSVLDHVAASGKKDDVVKPFNSKPIRTIDYGDAKGALLEGFNGVTHTSGGTAARVFANFPLDRFSVSGKTGTAEVKIGENSKADNSLFVGFGPMPDARYVASVMIQGGGFGADAAAPAVWMIFDPIATGAIDSFQVPLGGGIDAVGAAQLAKAQISTGGAD